MSCKYLYCVIGFDKESFDFSLLDSYNLFAEICYDWCSSNRAFLVVKICESSLHKLIDLLDSFDSFSLTFL